LLPGIVNRGFTLTLVGMLDVHRELVWSIQAAKFPVEVGTMCKLLATTI